MGRQRAGLGRRGQANTRLSLQKAPAVASSSAILPNRTQVSLPTLVARSRTCRRMPPKYVCVCGCLHVDGCIRKLPTRPTPPGAPYPLSVENRSTFTPAQGAGAGRVPEFAGALDGRAAACDHAANHANPFQPRRRPQTSTTCLILPPNEGLPLGGGSRHTPPSSKRVDPNPLRCPGSMASHTNRLHGVANLNRDIDQLLILDALRGSAFFVLWSGVCAPAQPPIAVDMVREAMLSFLSRLLSI